MNYRPLGSTGLQVSALGFGAMRLPVAGSDRDVVEDTAIRMLLDAVNEGVNYIDTAYVYHGGESERVVGKALAGEYRRKVFLATKLPVWRVKSAADFDRFLEEQLERLQTSYLDVYLLHSLQESTWEKVRALGVLRWAERARSAGKFRFFGFSFHDTFPVFESIVKAYRWDLCQIQYNYVNERVQAGTEGLKLAHSLGIGVIVMEPLLGGCLASPPPRVRRVFEEAGAGDRTVDLAFRWLWNKPEVAVVLSGMSTLEQVRENVALAGRASPPCLSQNEAELIERLVEAYNGLSPVPCTSCRYCMPCPSGVDIPANIQLYNSAEVHGGTNRILSRNLYRSMPQEAQASSCSACRQCEEHCPQGIEISAVMADIDRAFEKDS